MRIARSADAALKQALVEAGWAARLETDGANSKQVSLVTPDGKRARLGVLLEMDRPVAQITVIP